MTHTPFNYTPQEKADMYEFLDFLLANATAQTFDMSKYRTDYEDHTINVCNTAACICGWMPPFFVLKKWDIEEGNIDFENLPHKFGFTTYNRSIRDLDRSPSWSWCFGSVWKLRDNTIPGAIARIKYLYEVGLPNNRTEQINGYTPLSYTALNP
jgi:hypothetical protein